KAGQWLFTNHKISAKAHAHLMDDYTGFAQTLGIAVDEPEWHMPISEIDEQRAQKILFPNAQQPVAVISLAGNNGTPHWHVKGYVQTADYLEQLGFCVVLCSDSSMVATQLAESICQQSQASVLNLVGKTSIKQLLVIFKLAHITFSSSRDSIHMSTTVGTPVVGLYAFNNPRKVAPYSSQKYIVSCYEQVIEEQKGKPYAELAWGVQAKGKNLMDRLTVEEVKSKINLVLEDFYSVEFNLKS
ncbi:MAG: glycosyltransferase family 9 protein, partial [Nonlabens ulvanivorans]|uniref:glycosyltransferase family 9 protein n=1 Tax=Nonlabens ulvanivorans TaxID=906888 RepID=UPI00326388A6